MGQKALNIRDFPEDLKMELKIIAARSYKTLKEVIIEALTEYRDNNIEAARQPITKAK